MKSTSEKILTKRKAKDLFVKAAKKAILWKMKTITTKTTFFQN